MHICAELGNLDHMQALIDIGGNPVLETLHTRESKKSKDFITPIHISIANRNPEILRLLLKHTCNKEIITKKVIIKDHGETLISYATRIFTEPDSSFQNLKGKAAKRKAVNRAERALLVGHVLIK